MAATSSPQDDQTTRDQIQTTRDVLDWLLANGRVSLETHQDMSSALNSAEKHDLDDDDEE